MKKINFALLGVCMLLVSWLLPSTMTAQGEIKVTVGEKGWFKVEKLEGSNISVEGMPAGFTAEIGETIAQEYQATPNSTITFKGDIKGLRIVGTMHQEGGNKGNVAKRADIVKFDASKAPKSMKVLSLKGLNLAAEDGVIDLSGATELDYADLIDLSENKVYIPLLDLTKQTKVEYLFLANKNVNNGYFNEVKLPSPNVIKKMDLSRCWIKKIDFPKMPELYRFDYVAGGTPKVVIADAPKLMWVDAHYSHTKEFVFKNAPKLLRLMLGGNDGNSLTVENCPKLQQIHDAELPKKGGGTFKLRVGLWIEKSDDNPPSVIDFKTVKLTNVGITEFGGAVADGLVKVEDLDLSNNPITKLDFSTYPTLKKVTMSAIQFDNLDAEEVLATLPERKPEDNAEFVLLTDKNTDAALIAKIEAKLKERGWSLKQTTAVEELLAANAVKIYPTQTKDLVKIEGAKANMPYAVYAVSGKLCEKGMTDSFGSAEIHLNTYAKGVYLVKLGAKSQKIVLR